MKIRRFRNEIERENQEFGEEWLIMNLFQVNSRRIVSKLMGFQIYESFNKISGKILVGEVTKIEANPS